MSKELSKRILTSLFLISAMILAINYNYILIILLIIVSLISWIEFNALTFKIFKKQDLYTRSTLAVLKVLSLLYLLVFSLFVFDGVLNGMKSIEPNSKLNIIYLFSICIFSDIGGLIFGKIFKGKKLTKISPNKTISGSVGSFILSICLVPFFNYLFEKSHDLLILIILSFTVSLICQFGDLFISYLKRKAKVKDTGDLLPGHGGVLDRIDGMLFAIPIGSLLWQFLVIII
ncbi:phosphatidate cytidylyltransferase [Candidatus Pelagibacter sp.]|nr:phosphatidate cytidylyltransferase [Candidatus Pelagibacter sp.]